MKNSEEEFRVVVKLANTFKRKFNKKRAKMPAHLYLFGVESFRK